TRGTRGLLSMRTTAGYGCWVRSIQYSRTANLRAAATLATAFGFWWQRCRYSVSPALRNGEYCYFHRRWRMTTVDLSHSAHHVTSEFVLPVLEGPDSTQVSLGPIMR